MKSNKKEKARFSITGDKVQDVGCRALVVSKILEHSEVTGGAINKDDYVEVRVEGKREDVRKLHKDLKREFEKTNPIKGEIGKIDFNESVEVPEDTMRFSQSLQLNQMSKFVDVGLQLNKSLNKSMDKMDKSIKHMNKSINDSIDKLPEKIAKALKESSP